SIRAVELDARWHADQGNIDKAIACFREFIGAQGAKNAKPGPDAFVAFAQFLLRRGRTDAAMAAFRQAALYQEPGTHQVDLIMGDTQLSSGLFEDAEKSYRKVLDGGAPDADHKIRKRLIESMNQQQKYAEVEAEFVQMGAAADDDVEFLAQRAAAAR